MCVCVPVCMKVYVATCVHVWMQVGMQACYKSTFVHLQGSSRMKVAVSSSVTIDLDDP